MYTDNELAVLVSKGDRQAFDQLYHRYYNLIYSVILQYTKNAEDAEDILQQTFLKLWEKRTELPAITGLQNWLFILARNEFLNRFRKKRLEHAYRLYLLQVFTEEGESPEELLITRQAESVLQNAIRDLPERQREAFTLSRQKGFTYDQVASIMGVSRDTVKEHISRALKSIKTYLLANKRELGLLILITRLFHL